MPSPPPPPLDLRPLLASLHRSTREIATWPAWLRTMRERRLAAIAFIEAHKSQSE